MVEDGHRQPSDSTVSIQPYPLFDIIGGPTPIFVCPFLCSGVYVMRKAKCKPFSCSRCYGSPRAWLIT